MYVKSAMTPTDLQDNAGYRGLASERAVGAVVADHKEMFQWCTLLPEAHPLRVAYP